MSTTSPRPMRTCAVMRVGFAEGERAKADHREPVDLADRGAAGLDADVSSRDLLLHAAVDAVAAADLCVERTPEFRRRRPPPCPASAASWSASCSNSWMRPHAGRQPLGIAGQPRRLLDNPGDGVAVEGAQVLAPHDRGDGSRVEHCRVAGAWHAIIEIGGDLEQLGEILVMLRQQVVEHRRADQHDLDVERDRFRLQGHRSSQGSVPARSNSMRISPDCRPRFNAGQP